MSVEADLTEAIDRGMVLTVVYHGGSNPGQPREIRPLEIAGDRVRVRCMDDGIDKTFVLSRIQIIKGDGAAPADLTFDPSPGMDHYGDVDLWSENPRLIRHMVNQRAAIHDLVPHLVRNRARSRYVTERMQRPSDWILRDEIEEIEPDYFTWMAEANHDATLWEPYITPELLERLGGDHFYRNAMLVLEGIHTEGAFFVPRSDRHFWRYEQLATGGYLERGSAIPLAERLAEMRAPMLQAIGKSMGLKGRTKDAMLAEIESDGRLRPLIDRFSDCFFKAKASIGIDDRQFDLDYCRWRVLACVILHSNKLDHAY